MNEGSPNIVGLIHSRVSISTDFFSAHCLCVCVSEVFTGSLGDLFGFTQAGKPRGDSVALLGRLIWPGDLHSWRVSESDETQLQGGD